MRDSDSTRIVSRTLSIDNCRKQNSKYIEDHFFIFTTPPHRFTKHVYTTNKLVNK